MGKIDGYKLQQNKKKYVNKLSNTYSYFKSYNQFTSTVYIYVSINFIDINLMPRYFN